jgi:predicted small lipoprotein YifL
MWQLLLSSHLNFVQEGRKLQHRIHKGIAFGLLAAVLYSLAGCGVRGSLESPPAEADRTASADSGQGKPEGDTPKPHKGFILDGLIR